MISQTEQIEDLQTLNTIAQILNQAVDVQSALNAALEQLLTLMELQTGWVFTHDPAATEKWAGRGFILAAHHALPPALHIDSPQAWYKGCSCQAACLKGDWQDAYNEVHCSRLAETSGDKQDLAVHASTPLKSGERILGILNVAAHDWSDFTPRSLTLLTLVGNQMGIAIERARLFDLLREQRVHEQAALLELTNRLLGHPNMDDLMNFIVEEVCDLITVDACGLLLPEKDDPAWLRFRAASGWRSNPVRNHYRVPADERSNSGRVLRTQRPIVIVDSENMNPKPWMWDWLQEEGFISEAIVPLVVEGRSLGTMLVCMRERRRLDENELRFMQLMANQAAIAIEGARLQVEERRRWQMERELLVGRQIQESMLPAQCPMVPGWQFAAIYEAARLVGGDFYDFFPLNDRPGQWGIVIADVSDKGVPAALFMALSRTTIRNTALPNTPPGEALCRANRFIRQDSQSDMFLSVFYGTLDTHNGRFTYSSAGHNWPLWWQANTQSFQALKLPGIVLGVMDEIELAESNIDVHAGDVLIFYTDGVTEAVNAAEEEVGLTGLETAVADHLERDPEISAQTLITVIVDALKTHTADVPQQDDTTLCIVKRE